MLMGDLMRDTQELGKKINELRLKNDMSLRDLGEKSGVSYSFINSIEKGRYSPSRDTVIALANSLDGADINELLLLAGFSPMQEKTEFSDKNNARVIFQQKLHWDGVPLTEEQLKPIRELLEMVAKERLPRYLEEQKKDSTDN